MINLNFAPNENWHGAWQALSLFISPRDTADVNEKVKTELSQLWDSQPEDIILLLSGRSALYGVLKALSLKNDDEVIVQAFTCEAVVLPIIELQLRPIYGDIELETYSLSFASFIKLVTPKTKVIILQHTFGMTPKDRKEIISFAQERNITVIEDCAHGFYPHFSVEDRYKTIKIVSFGRSKLFSSVHGGAIVIPQEDVKSKFILFYDQFPFPSNKFLQQILVYKIVSPVIKTNFIKSGSLIHKLFSGIFTHEISQKEKQTEYDNWLDKKLPDLLCQLVLPQLQNITTEIERRKNIANIYTQKLGGNFSRLPLLRFPYLCTEKAKVVAALKKKNIIPGNWYDQPIAPRGINVEKLQYHDGMCPVAEEVCERIINLPLTVSSEEALEIATILKNAELQKAEPIKIIELKEKEVWEEQITHFPYANFLQSWNWGQFHASLGKSVHYLSILSSTKVVGNALVVTEKARRGTYLTIAGGPLLHWNNFDAETVLDALLTKLSEIAKKENALFVRVRLQEKDSPKLRKLLSQNNFNLSPMHLTADLTLQLNLTKPAEQLLIEMRKNTRYEIKRAQKLGITTRFSQNPDEIKAFYEEQLAVAKRHNFVPFSYQFLQKQFEAFVQDNQVVLIHSYENDTLLATAFIIFYNNEAVYHYGISTEANAKLPGSYACQWAAIQEAKKRGVTRYNFWGIAPEHEKTHRFAGVGLFKRGFGGEEVAYVPAYDYAFSWQYFFVWLFERARKKMRKL